MRKPTQVLLIALVAAYAAAVYAQTSPAKKERPDKVAVSEKEAKPDDLAAFMRQKLDYAQKVLEGLTIEDFELIAHYSNKMALLVKDENWMVKETPQYKHHSADFETVANRLTKAAREKNLDGATLAYVDLTMKCVNCHKYTRGAKLALRD